MLRWLLLVWALLISGAASAIDPKAFESDDDRARYERWVAELRCLVCQNENLADSNAPLAQDLRTEIAGMITAGASDAEVESYMVDRYGEFVLYRPRLNARTVALWFGPFALLVVAGLLLVRMVRSRAPTDDEEELA